MIARLALASALLAAAPAAAGDDFFVPAPQGTEWGEQVNEHDSLQFSLIPAGRRNVLLVWGGIEFGDSDRFRTALDAAGPIEEIWLYSGGGKLREGLEIGRIVRARRLATRIKRGMQCMSACNFIFMGGTIRYVEMGGDFGVHMFSNKSYVGDILKRLIGPPPKDIDEFNHNYYELDAEEVQAELDTLNKKDPDHPTTLQELLRRYVWEWVLDGGVRSIQQDSAQTAAEIARYLVEMSLSLRFLTEFADIPSSTHHNLTRQQLRDFNIINTD